MRIIDSLKDKMTGKPLWQKVFYFFGIVALTVIFYVVILPVRTVKTTVKPADDALKKEQDNLKTSVEDDKKEINEITKKKTEVHTATKETHKEIDSADSIDFFLDDKHK